jgi:HSP20 family molecular chaperone IbpA
MTDADSKEIQVKEKKEVASPAEQTRPGIVFTPDVDIFETEKEIVLMADLPGVDPDQITIDLRDDVLTLTGDIAPIESGNETPLLVEYQTGKYQRQFTLSEVIDQAQIDAKYTDGVLRLRLPKVEKAAPRKITVQAG